MDSTGGPGPGPNPDPDPDPDPPPSTESQLSGDITDSVSLSGELELIADATIKPGAAVVIEAGSTLLAAEGTTLTVEGQLVIDGTADSTVSITPADGATAWTGIAVASGGSAEVRYATGTAVGLLMACRAGASQCVLEGIDFTAIGQLMRAESTALIDKSRIETMRNGGVTLAGGDLTIRDTYLLDSDHDIVVASGGGNLTVEYSEIGGAQGAYEHCDLHIGSADSVSVTHSNIISAVYGMMIGGTSGATINNNNFESNNPNNDVLEVGTVSNIDMQSNYWDQGAPANLGPSYNVGNASQTRLTDTGPRI